jgi:hypothetical protein
MTTPDSHPEDLQNRTSIAQVVQAEADASKAVTDAQTSALTLAQTKYKALVPDFSTVATNVVDDKSTGVGFSGLVTYAALNHAAETVADRIVAALPRDQVDVLAPAAGVLAASDAGPASEPEAASDAGPASESREKTQKTKPQTILVTSQSDLLTNDLLAGAVTTALGQLSKFASDAIKSDADDQGGPRASMPSRSTYWIY